MGAIRILLIAAMLLAAAASAALAKTKIDVQAGYSDRYRPGRWVPVTVTVQSDQPRAGVLELRVPNASASTMTIRQEIGLSQQPQKYVLYAPLALQTDPLSAVVFDKTSGKSLADWPPEDQNNFNVKLGLTGEAVTFVLLTTGRSPALQNYRRGGITGNSLVDHVRPSRLPTTPIGLDAADVLFINDPDWSAIDRRQQQAIIDWVNAGGTLLLWPGMEAVPPDAPLAAILPATIGDPTTLRLTSSQLARAGLGQRFGTLPARTLAPAAGATTVELLGGAARAVVGRRGLGQIAVLPADLGVLQFNDESQRQDVWDVLFNQLLPAKDGTQARNNYFQSPDIEAATVGLNAIGDIPNTGAFGFTYVAVLIGAMMLVVGPIDYFVLKKIGHQPWTWGTTLGWIGLITVGALYAGHALRSGDLHFRTLRLIEQAPDGVTSETALALVYAPRSSDYSITAGPGWWWQPVPSGNRYNAGTTGAPLDTHQSDAGNTPEKMWIDVWNWRFLQGKRVVARPPMLTGHLTAMDGRIVGTLRNTGDRPLKTVLARAKDNPHRTLLAGEIAPGAEIKIDIADDKSAAHDADDSNEQNAGVPYAMPATPQYPANVNAGTWGLDDAQFAAFDSALERGAVVVTADVDQPNSDITIDQPNAVTQHRAMLRAIIEPPVPSPGNPGEG